MVQPAAQAGGAFTEGQVEADGFRIRYLEAGQGSPVVMLHGLGGLALTKVHHELARKYRVIAFEMPGFGHSPPTRAAGSPLPQSEKALARTMAQAAANLGVDRYALLGTSFGGWVALWQALQSPQQVDLLVLISPTAVLPEGYTLPSAAPTGAGLKPAPTMFAHPENAPAHSAVDPATPLLSPLTKGGLQGGMALLDSEVENKLIEVQALTLVVFGTADKVVPPAMGRVYRERIPNCHYVLVYDAGHAIAQERPEALTNALTDFLDLRETFIVSRRDGRINP